MRVSYESMKRAGPEPGLELERSQVILYSYKQVLSYLSFNI